MFLEKFFGGSEGEPDHSEESRETVNLQHQVDDAEASAIRAGELQAKAAQSEYADPAAAAELVEQRNRELAEARAALEQHTSDSPESAGPQE